MEVEIRIYLARDSFGNESYAVCEETGDAIMIYGLRTNKKVHHFDNDAGYLETWCRQRGFEYKCIVSKEDFSHLWDRG